MESQPFHIPTFTQQPFPAFSPFHALCLLAWPWLQPRWVHGWVDWHPASVCGARFTH